MHALLYAGHCLGWWILPQYLQGCHGVVRCTGIPVLSSFTLLDIFILSNCLDSVSIFNTAAWALCAATLLAHAYTPPLVMQSSFQLLLVPLLFSPTYIYHLGYV